MDIIKEIKNLPKELEDIIIDYHTGRYNYTRIICKNIIRKCINKSNITTLWL